jgi:cysteine-rich repeat protein
MKRFCAHLTCALSLLVGCPSSFADIEGATVCETRDDCAALGAGVGCFLPGGQARGFCVAYCGDGVLRQDIDKDGNPDPGEFGFEACDDANRDDADGCTNSCRVARCGDGVLRTDVAPEDPAYEACDDGNVEDTDGCLNNCTVARCGDGVRRKSSADDALGQSEECDDGNESSGDGCTGCWATLDFLQINGGDFSMGSDGSVFGDEAPAHTVTIETFSMAKHEVTVSLYDRCITAGDCPEPVMMETHAGSDILEDCNYGKHHRALHPMNCITLPEIDAFRAWFQATYQQGVRLPSEAEWEFAARSRGLDQSHPWGDSPATCDRAVIENGCGEGASQTVCSRPAGNSAEGLCDLIGNVWEWTQDRYHSSYTGAPADGSAWIEGTSPLWVMRGGSWMDEDPRFLRSALRLGISPYPQKEGVVFDLALSIIGFRLVLER